MIQSTIRMTIPRQKTGAVLTILKSLCHLCRYDSGCLSSNIYEDMEENNVMMFQEVWKTEEDLKRHICAGEYRDLLLILEMAIKQPEIRFDTIASSKGIEIIEQARGQAI